ncbi:hypothetical protein HF670_07230 [Acidithiobacillus thiooxidans]|jgi:uncharacterized membrane protein HdeD (DUF308 family)|uniref:HdeD family acid-resistance protein n=2 Tax=Acidithiobacillus thiooxidans TaxID=930 RepID=A0A543PZS1_ACITH|nr:MULTISPECIES: hypothetical protein [Acidithiobacillus]MBE7567589.1 hypothetical protein [Acidithiobacillus sp. HP-11]MBU2743076.1 hypothetical protein [Acidithiobacillus albertensis]MBU2752001.1 hypothetical protein [Acidithiobacillus thiooxidans]MBU2792828.1 hypothetical protein [Acidithiobacillus thiooxidans]MBU2812188.1 hypothetical protein [Acidithiobacillus thiooxidans]
MNSQASTQHARLTLFSWPLLAARGVAALLFVIASLIAFGETMTLLVWFFAIYVFFDGGYSAMRLAQKGSGACPKVLIAIKAVIGIAAGIAVIILSQGASLLPTLLTIFAWVAIVGVIEGIWVLRNVRNKEAVMIIGSTAYLALAVALQFIFALAPDAGPSVYNWIIIGFSAAFAAAMFGMAWAMRRNLLKMGGGTSSASAQAHSA